MKYIFALAVATLMATSAIAGTTCRTDPFGTMRCTDNSGSTTTINKDPWGNTTIRDNSGNRTVCRTDAFGTIRCN